MITNSTLTIYHKSGLDPVTHFEKWTRYNYDNVWFFASLNGSENKGYDQSNDVQIRIPYSKNQVDINNFSIGDIIVKGTLENDIETQQDLQQHSIYNITSIKNNDFGNNPHIHLGGR